jgi:hypothetical protein
VKPFSRAAKAALEPSLVWAPTIVTIRGEITNQ